MFGNYRKDESETIRCQKCLGVGNKSKVIWKRKCDSCSGKGKFNYWSKDFFGTAYLRESKYSNCNGAGEIDTSSSVIFNGELELY